VNGAITADLLASLRTLRPARARWR